MLEKLLGDLVTPRWVVNARALADNSAPWPLLDPTGTDFGMTETEVRAALGDPNRVMYVNAKKYKPKEENSQMLWEHWKLPTEHTGLLVLSVFQYVNGVYVLIMLQKFEAYR